MSTFKAGDRVRAVQRIIDASFILDPSIEPPDESEDEVVIMDCVVLRANANGTYDLLPDSYPQDRSGGWLGDVAASDVMPR